VMCHVSGWSVFSPSCMKASVLVIASDCPQVGDLYEMLRRAGYRVEVTSHPLTGADVRVGTRATVLVVSDPYWQIERICLIYTAIRNSAPNLPLAHRWGCTHTSPPMAARRDGENWRAPIITFNQYVSEVRF